MKKGEKAYQLVDLHVVWANCGPSRVPTDRIQIWKDLLICRGIWNSLRIMPSWMSLREVTMSSAKGHTLLLLLCQVALVNVNALGPVFISDLQRVDDVHNTPSLLAQQATNDPCSGMLNVVVCMDASGMIADVYEYQLHSRGSRR